MDVAFLTRGADLLLVLSNLFFLIPFVGAIRQRRWTRAAIFFFMCFLSLMYHLCDSFSVCAFAFGEHAFFDFFTANYLLVLTGLYLMVFAPRYQWIERWLIIAGGVLTAVLMILIDESLVVQGILIATILVMLLVYYMIWGVPSYDLSYLLLGVALALLGTTLYTFQNTLPGQYWHLHASWHIVSALGQYYLLFIKPKANGFQAADARIEFTQFKRK